MPDWQFYGYVLTSFVWTQIYNSTITDRKTEQSKLLAYAKEVNLLIEDYKKAYEKMPFYWVIAWFAQEENFPQIIVVP